MQIFKITLLVAIFSTTAIGAPAKAPLSTSNEIARDVSKIAIVEPYDQSTSIPLLNPRVKLTKAEITQKYKAAEAAAKRAIEQADDLQHTIYIGRKKITPAQLTQMTTILKTAWAQGHQAESWRGSYHTAYPQDADDNHAAAIEWINTNIMVRAQNLATTYKIQL